MAARMKARKAGYRHSPLAAKLRGKSKSVANAERAATMANIKESNARKSKHKSKRK